MSIVYKESAVLRVLKHYDGDTEAFAKSLGVTRGAIYQWLDAGHVPASRAIQIERLTRGKFKAIELVK